jgi:hypothetical protein
LGLFTKPAADVSRQSALANLPPGRKSVGRTTLAMQPTSSTHNGAPSAWQSLELIDIGSTTDFSHLFTILVFNWITSRLG